MNASRFRLVLVVLSSCQLSTPTGANSPGAEEEALSNPQTTEVSPSRPHLACPPPTLAQCRSALWRVLRCGRLEMARARVDPQAPCNLLMGDAAQALSTTLPTREVVAPEVVSSTGVVATASSLDGDDCNAGEGHTCARFRPYSNNGHFARGFSATSHGMAAMATSMLPLDNVTEEARGYRLMTAIRDAFYAANGNMVESCHEYVYEKYFDYTQFETEAARRGNDPRAFVDTAFGSESLPSSIGSRVIAGLPLAGRDGTPFSDGIEFPVDQKKNVFFETKVAHLSEPIEPLELPCLDRQAVAFYAVHLNDPTLTDAILQDPRHDESFVWHRDMNQALREAEILDEELYYLDALKQEFRGLLERRARLERALTNLLESAVAAADRQRAVNINPLAGILDPILALGYLAAMDGAGLDILAAGGELPAVATFVLYPSMDFTRLVPVEESELSHTFQAIADGLCITGYNDLSTVEQFMVAFATVDDAIENALVRARDVGCLDVDNPYSPCDWSPELFSARAVGLFTGEREHDFERCVAYTANDFAKLSNKEFRVDGDIICPARDFRETPTAVEDYMTCVDAWRQATIEKIESTQGSILDPATGKVRIGKTQTDDFDLGSETLGGSLHYSGGWEVIGFEGTADIGALSLYFGGHADANASIFGSSQELANAGVEVTNEQIDVTLTIVGEDIYLGSPEQSFQGSLHSVQDGAGRQVVFVRASVIVPVLGIPVTVRGSVSGEAGLNYSATTMSASAPAERVLVGYAEPYVGATATVSASIDAAIVEVGVKGSVAVIRLGMPLTAGVHIHLPAGDDEVQLEVDSRGDFTLSMLAGRVAVFGEIDTFVWSESVEVPLFSWGGFKDNNNLYQMAYTVPVEPLFWLANQSGY